MQAELYARRSPANGSPVAAARVTQARSPVSQDIIHNYAPGKIYSPSERSTAATRGGPGGGTAVFSGVRFPRREMEAAAGLGDAGPGLQSKSLSSEIYAQSRGRWRDEARKQRLCRRRRARSLLAARPPPLPGAPRYNCGALHLRRR